ncbi:hypothetical protein [Bdellovibrio sp. GT3]|uniref:hypothetical protein n=1 Tax=Bdellovibrio sp. GT3 TaxID=3136282 RepID=UPI0030F2078C
MALAAVFLLPPNVMFSAIGGPLIVAHGIHGFYKRAQSNRKPLFVAMALLGLLALLLLLGPAGTRTQLIVATVSQILFVIHFALDELFFENTPYSLKRLPEILVLPLALLALHLADFGLWGYLFLGCATLALLSALALHKIGISRFQKHLLFLTLLTVLLFMGEFKTRASALITYTALVHFFDWYEYTVRNSSKGPQRAALEIAAFWVPIQVVGVWYYQNPQVLSFLSYVYDPHYIAIGIIWHVCWSLRPKGFNIMPVHR